MYIELVGCTNAGKSTLSRRMLAAAADGDSRLTLGSDRVAGLLGVRRSKSLLVRSLSIHVVAALGCCLCPLRCFALTRFALRELRRQPISRCQRWNQLRKILKQLGCFEIVRRLDRKDEMTIVDEGAVHSAHNLFVHVGGSVSERELSNFAELTPLPDVIVCIRQPHDVLIERTIERPHPRIPKSSPEQVVTRFLLDAVKTFDMLVNHDRLRQRTIVVDGDSIHPPSGDRDPKIESVLGVLRLALRTNSSAYTESALT